MIPSASATRARRSWSMRLPATDMTASSRSVGSESLDSRTLSASRRVSGKRRQPTVVAVASSVTKYGMPWLCSAMSLTSASDGVRPFESSMSSPVSACDSRATSTRTLPGCRPASTRKGRNGWRRGSSSERNEQTMSSLALSMARVTNRSRLSVDSSAQCRSSTMMSSGAAVAACSKIRATASNCCSRSCDALVSSTRLGSRGASAAQPAPAHCRTVVRPCRTTSSRRIQVSGARARPSSPSGTHWPVTCCPSGPSCWDSQESSVDFPMPASPPSRTTPGCP